VAVMSLEISASSGKWIILYLSISKHKAPNTFAFAIALGALVCIRFPYLKILVILPALVVLILIPKKN